MESIASLLGFILSLLGFVLILGSCSAMLAAPVTTPIWFITGLLFLYWPRFASLWRNLNGFHTIAFLFITLLGLIGIVSGASITNNRGFANGPVFPFIGLALTVISALIWHETSLEEDSRDIKGWIMLQLGVAVAAFVYVISLVASIWPKT